MAEQPQWDGTPAIGVILAKITELYARAVRVELERQKRDNERLVAMFTPEVLK